ncbi:MAG TPA: matrixin family metalloprotease [Actinomycetota bacterium]
MRKAALAMIAVAVAAWGSGVSLAEVPTTCGTLFITYPEGVGFVSPEAAAENAVAEFDSGVDLPTEIGEGETELGGYDAVVVERTAAGYVTHAIRECVVETVLAFGAVARAHNPDLYVNPFAGDGADHWGGAHPDVIYHFTQEVPIAHAASIKRGIETWDQVQMDLTLTQGAKRANSNVDFVCPNNNEVHYENIGTTAAGAVMVCEGTSGNIVSFEMGIDKASYWYTGADPAAINPPACGGTGLPSCQVDLQSVATHEGGHVLGIDHLDGVTGTCPDGGGAATMCLANGVSWGETYTRSLEDHDIHTITPLYP